MLHHLIQQLAMHCVCFLICVGSVLQWFHVPNVFWNIPVFPDGLKWRSCLEDISQLAKRMQEWMEQKSGSTCRADHTQAMACEDFVYKGWWRVHLCPSCRYYWPWLLAQESCEWRIHTEGKVLQKLLTQSFNIFVHFTRQLFSPTWTGLWLNWWWNCFLDHRKKQTKMISPISQLYVQSQLKQMSAHVYWWAHLIWVDVIWVTHLFLHSWFAVSFYFKPHVQTCNCLCNCLCNCVMWFQSGCRSHETWRCLAACRSRETCCRWTQLHNVHWAACFYAHTSKMSNIWTNIE